MSTDYSVVTFHTFPTSFISQFVCLNLFIVNLTNSCSSSFSPPFVLSFNLGQANNLLSTASSAPSSITKCPPSSGKQRIVCFYRVEDEFRPFDLNPCLCTHIVYSYVAVKENFAFIAGKKGKTNRRRIETIFKLFFSL